MLRNVLCLVMLVSFCMLNGCASNSGSAEMAYSGVEANKKPRDPALSHAITVSDVTGGQETNPLLSSQISNENFKEALKLSLEKANLHSNSLGGKYKLNAKLIKLDQPFLGLDLTVTAQVHYILKNSKTNQVIYNKNIDSSYTAKVSDSYVAITRLKMANEGAARANIQNLIEDLYGLQVR